MENHEALLIGMLVSSAGWYLGVRSGLCNFDLESSEFRRNRSDVRNVGLNDGSRGIHNRTDDYSNNDTHGRASLRDHDNLHLDRYGCDRRNPVLVSDRSVQFNPHDALLGTDCGGVGDRAVSNTRSTYKSCCHC